jgi:hypothetical protein
MNNMKRVNGVVGLALLLFPLAGCSFSLSLDFTSRKTSDSSETPSEPSADPNGVRFVLNEDQGSYSAYGDVNTVKAVVVPSTYQNLPVTAIGTGAFQHFPYLTQVSIPDSVTQIDDQAFAFCRSLTSIQLPDGVTSLGFQAFFMCSNLSGVTLGNSLTSIPDQAFTGCRSLQRLTIPSKARFIGKNAFTDCASLTSIEIPDSLYWIKDEAFHSCSSLKSLTLPTSITSIGDRAFLFCSSLSEVYVPLGVLRIGHTAFGGSGSGLTLSCQIASQPSGWASDWCRSDCTVLWNVSKN